jgi:4-hydroxy-3-polyprenylbenzoate decarboxylase
LVKCKTVDLEVPAYSEVVLEGEMIPNVTVEEGPFGEYTGFRSSPRMPRTLFKVNCITYRNDPILGISNMGTPVDDWDIIMSIGFGHRVHKALESQGIPVKGVNYVPEGCGHLCVVSTETPYANIATQIANILFGTRGPHMYLHHLIVVGPDVNPFNLVEVIHSLATQCDPSRGIQIRYNETSNPLTPHPTFEERKWSKGSKVVYDCTWPVWWSKEIEIPVKSSFNSIYPKNIQKKVLDNWNNYGF